jgi:hypothetical protein
MKTYHDSKLPKKQQPGIEVGDSVLVRQVQANKKMTRYDPKPWVVVATNNSMITARRNSQTTTRNVSFFRKTCGEGTS